MRYKDNSAAYGMKMQNLTNGAFLKGLRSGNFLHTWTVQFTSGS